MIKSLGIFAFAVYLLLSSQMGGFTPGASIWLLSFLTMIAGISSVFCLTAPEEIVKGALGSIRKPLPIPLGTLIQDLEELALLVRRDGLLSLESKRRDLKDPLLQTMLKKIMDGFEKGQILPLLRNQATRHAELIRMCEIYLERATALIPTVGLITSLWMIMLESSPATAFIPFLITLIVQVVFSALTGRFFDQLKEDIKLYYVLLEEGVSGIQDGLNSELLREKLRARIH